MSEVDVVNAAWLSMMATRFYQQGSDAHANLIATLAYVRDNAIAHERWLIQKECEASHLDMECATRDETVRKICKAIRDEDRLGWGCIDAYGVADWIEEREWSK